ncbi:MAG: hypothetical protein V1790_13645 [Planctomycetota bacterium]
MNDSERQRGEIERDEQWLAGVCERSAEIDPARIKRAVRVAIEEQWLARNLSPDAPAGLSRRARHAVQEALAAAPRAGLRGHRRVVRVWAWIGGGLAAAAAVVLTVLGPWRLAATSDGDEASTSFVSAFEEFKDEDEALDQELSQLRAAFYEFDQTVANGWGEESWEEPVDEASDLTEDGV